MGRLKARPVTQSCDPIVRSPHGHQGPTAVFEWDTPAASLSSSGAGYPFGPANCRLTALGRGSAPAASPHRLPATHRRSSVADRAPSMVGVITAAHHPDSPPPVNWRRCRHCLVTRWHPRHCVALPTQPLCSATTARLHGVTPTAASRCLLHRRALPSLTPRSSTAAPLGWPSPRAGRGTWGRVTR
jgi:hypothetical protein